MTDSRTPDDNAPDTATQDAQASPAEDPAAQAAREAAEYKDRWLRALAEMENLRRRTEREVGDARAYAVTQFARDVVTVADNMERALQALDNELREKADAAVKGLLDGVELTERELLKVLEKHGVRKLEPQGQKFDPHRHQAMFEVPDESVPAGTVVQVVQSGYVIGDRVLRPALVGVAKGGPKAASPSGEAESTAPANDNSQGS
ncbi:MAG TPA: nucleotide exchange factor GrpE [Xanthobacteraceae bacterium]|nr:nucleotide exchange factor GrpE [Xanthobacteraceae bacterium]